MKLYRAAWGEYIVASKTFKFLYHQGTCLALNSECHQANFKYVKISRGNFFFPSLSSRGALGKH